MFGWLINRWGIYKKKKKKFQASLWFFLQMHFILRPRLVYFPTFPVNVCLDMNVAGSADPLVGGDQGALCPHPQGKGEGKGTQWGERPFISGSLKEVAGSVDLIPVLALWCRWGAHGAHSHRHDVLWGPLSPCWWFCYLCGHNYVASPLAPQVVLSCGRW